MIEQYVWSEFYRPKTVEDTILPPAIKSVFQGHVNQKHVPNLVLAGSTGIGKTTVARAMLEELGCDYIVINGSLDGNIDTLRTKIKSFASTVSLRGGRKYVIVDEADHMTNATQAALRGFVDQYSKNCGFIFTCNYINRIIDPLKDSRFTIFTFKVPKSDLPELAKQMLKRLVFILEDRNVSYDKQVLAAVIKKYYPNWRKMITEIQAYAIGGAIDSGILNNFKETSIKELADLLKGKNFSEMRKWVGENATDSESIYRDFYDSANQFFKKASIPMLVLLIAKYQYQHAFVADHEINLAAFLTEVMMECEFD